MHQQSPPPEFDVWARNGSNYVMGSDANGFLIRKNSTIGVVDAIKSATNVWGYANEEDVTYWPQGVSSLQFFGIAPSRVSGTVPGLTNLSIGNNAFSFDYEAKETTISGTIADHNLKTSHNNQRDVVVTAKNINFSDINVINNTKIWMSVPLTFKHVLSLISFEGMLESGIPNLNVKVYSITICNAVRSGHCSVDANGNATWSNLGTAQRYAYTIMCGDDNGIQLHTTDGVYNGPVVNSGNDPTPLSSGSATTNSDILMVVPQSFTAWNTTGGTVAKPDEQAGSYLKIRCDIMMGNSKMLAEPYVYVPLKEVRADGTTNNLWDQKWEMGKHYKYRLVFGFGRDSNGKQNGTEITFTVNLDNSWSTTGNTVILQ